MKNTVFILTVGSYGDFFPLLELSKSLVSQGFNVFFISNELDVQLSDFESLNGIQFRSFIPFSDIQVLLTQTEKKIPSNINNLQTIFRLFKYIAPYNHSLELTVQHCLDSCNGPTHFLVHPLLVNPMLVIKERFNVDYSIVNFSPIAFQLLWYQALVSPILSRSFVNNIMSALFRLTNISLPEKDSKHLIFVSKSIAPRQFRFLKNVQFSGTIRYDRHQSENDMYGTLTADILSFLEKYPQPVVATFGTMEGTSLNKKYLFKETIDYMTSKRKPMIVLCKQDIFDDDIPDHIFVCKFAPLYQVLKHASVLIYHGGIGTFYTASLAGIPQIIVPSAYDQFVNEKLAKKLGIAVSIPARKYNQKRLGYALAKIDGSNSIRPTCKKVQENFQAEDGIPAAVQYLKEYF